MLLCLKCGLQKPNYYKPFICPSCESYLKYVEASAKPIVIKLHEAGLHISFAVAELYSYATEAIHVANIRIGLSQPYPDTVFRLLPDGYDYLCPEVYTQEYLSKIPLAQAISPVKTYAVLRFEADYHDHNEAKSALKQKLQELDAWIEEAVADGWFSICHLGGWLD